MAGKVVSNFCQAKPNVAAVELGQVERVNL